MEEQKNLELKVEEIQFSKSGCIFIAESERFYTLAVVSWRGDSSNTLCASYNGINFEKERS